VSDVLERRKVMLMTAAREAESQRRNDSEDMSVVESVEMAVITAGALSAFGLVCQLADWIVGAI
jgi:hypothetical protein